MNVIKQALELRLGIGAGDAVKALSGPETSATIMASDFLLAELKSIVDQQRSKPQSVAHQHLMDDVMGGDNLQQQQQDETNVLWGGGGITMGGDDADGSGVDPNNFY